MSESERLKGRSVLVVEDEALVAMMLEDLLAEAGATVIGPAATIEEALAAARDAAPLHAALLDVNLGGRPVFPVADALDARRIPYAFASGYGDAATDGRFADHPVLAKPFTEDTLLRTLERLIGAP